MVGRIIVISWKLIGEKREEGSSGGMLSSARREGTQSETPTPAFSKGKLTSNVHQQFLGPCDGSQACKNPSFSALKLDSRSVVLSIHPPFRLLVTPHLDLVISSSSSLRSTGRSQHHSLHPGSSDRCSSELSPSTGSSKLERQSRRVFA